MGLSRDQAAEYSAALMQTVAVWERVGRKQDRAAEELGIPRTTVQARIRAARAKGLIGKPRLSVRADMSPPAAPATPPPLNQGPLLLPPAWTVANLPTYTSRPDNTYLFGACGDTHLGSKYERLDALNDLYDRYEREGCDRVYHTGNWVDGTSRFNTHDIHTGGIDGQMRYLAREYPRRGDLITYAVTGDDHEGWWAQREGIDPGVVAEETMRRAGRMDWVNLGYMEAHIRLVNANSGRESILAVVHPGGGSAYALSYSIQKIIESLDGGEKPAVALYGHYHKLHGAINIRNVWAIQTGSTKDQDPFMRKKKIESHVGGIIVGLEQDPETGAIIGCRTECVRYFNKGYYNGRWSHSGAVILPERGV